MSRQLRKQRKLRSEGKCQSCGRPAEESPRGGVRALCLGCARRRCPKAKPQHPRSAWAGVDWREGNKEIAEQMDVDISTVSKWRKKVTGCGSCIDWSKVDWTKTNAILAQELGRTVTIISRRRNKAAPVELRSMAWKMKNLK